MNKYALIISAAATMGGVSNTFSSVKEFCNDMAKEHPKKLLVAGALGALSKVTGGGILVNNWRLEATINHELVSNKIVKLPTLAAGIFTYSVLKTAYDRSKKSPDCAVVYHQ